MKSVDEGQSKAHSVIIKIGIDCSLDDVDITAELRVIGGLVYSTVTFQSHPCLQFFSNCECWVAKQGSF